MLARAEIVLALLLAGCTCDGEEAIAELVEKDGRVDRDFAASVNTWESAARGASFAVGDGVRTSDDSRATLQLRGGARLAMEHSTEIRFSRSAEEGGRLEVTTGSAMLEAGDARSRIDTDLGLAVLEPGTRVRLTGTDLSVVIGAASIETEEGRRSLEEGETFTTAEEEAAEPTPPEPSQEPVVAPEEDGVDVVVEGRVERESGDEWSALSAGSHQIAPGTRLRLARDATATIEQDGDRVRARGAGVIVVAPSETELLESLGGRANIEANVNEVRVRVPGGVIVATVASTGDVRIEETATEVRAERGRILLRDAAGVETALDEGERGSIARAETEETAQAEDGPADLELSAGGSVVIHDAAAPLLVRFNVECEGGTVELRPGRGALVHRLARGRHSYAVRCGTARQGRGRVTVMTDTGEARLPRAPPSSIVDMDGRAYTVLYQNQLPVITVRWRNAPQRGPYRLSFVNARRPAVVSQTPTFAFASGDLADGTHRIVVEAGGTRSEPTTLAIRFDNAAPAASVQEPPNGGFSPGQQVMVRGMALSGWSVHIAGHEITLDDSRRFATSVVAPQGPIVIRLSHPRHGVHYYLRRPRGS